MNEKHEHILNAEISELLHHVGLHPDSKAKRSDATFAGTKQGKWDGLSVDFILTYWNGYTPEERERATKTIRCKETGEPFAIFPRETTT